MSQLWFTQAKTRESLFLFKNSYALLPNYEPDSDDNDR
jgi:hypothetical protein